MKTLTQTTAAKSASKAPSKAPSKQASKAPSLIYAAILGEALTGKFGKLVQRFYINAIAYHTKQETTFPRGRIANEPLLNETDTRAFIAKHDKTSIPAGSTVGQRIFDQMMVESKQAKASK